MDNTIMIKIPEAAQILNISRTQAYRLVDEWRKAGIVRNVGTRSIRINRKGLLEWAGEKSAA